MCRSGIGVLVCLLASLVTDWMRRHSSHVLAPTPPASLTVLERKLCKSQRKRCVYQQSSSSPFFIVDWAHPIYSVERGNQPS
ncbi:uncharacterized protein BYT42DRAFT_584958 [Radiomyces spectabilis]|uniref:uncharacterized protein n=1 Tax=Radiomyces spectabilis TaxID=64574 RepID=UPI0022203927|nr:uncharacterized protein BYT42DRAFT_584958 [Radiomyces spectabilis]KAI8369572.1 hypothetical protein BYT42DRAFT_584958 [Radiomyces spectabilis]